MNNKHTLAAKSLIKNNPLFFFGVSALIGCILLNFGIFRDYAFTDSYEFIWLADVSPIFQHEFIRGGRPLYGLLNQFTFGTLCDSISSLKWIRFIGLLGSVLFSIQIFKFLLKLKLKPFESALFSFLMLSIPSFTIFIGWSATYQIPWSLSISFFAGLILMKALEDKKINILKCLIALALVIISLSLYQSAGTAFLIPFIFTAVVSNQFEKRTLIQLLVFLGISLILYFIVFKINLYYLKVEALGRSQLNIIKFPFRYLLFYVRELKTILKVSGIILGSHLFLIIGYITFIGFFVKQKIANKNYFVIFFLLFVLPLSYLPNLVADQVWKCSRTVAPAAISVLFYQFYFLKQLSQSNKVIKYVSLLLAISVLTVGFINQNMYISDIQHREYKALRKAFEKIPLDNTKNIIFIIPNPDFLKENGYYSDYYSDEFIRISSSKEWASSPLLNQIQKEKSKLNSIQKSYVPNHSYEVRTINDPAINTNNSIIINLNELLKKEFSK
ncbi:glucosyltransferase domain-containing protein [Mariniflexile sp. AS56]|uniref:glucosyltransferase domain-containing protein n=1 Tax=Mariniflexile sp. AS56 TaxID=3063957 RepID=UPI0026ED6101|nr:glucosyltransferase domain-containing protein [Mariniflexile sp. AS56]MDO7173969.1 hypothetical protein [Mariniflexile sp. AS56]